MILKSHLIKAVLTVHSPSENEWNKFLVKDFMLDKSIGLVKLDDSKSTATSACNNSVECLVKSLICQ